MEEGHLETGMPLNTMDMNFSKRLAINMTAVASCVFFLGLLAFVVASLKIVVFEETAQGLARQNPFMEHVAYWLRSEQGVTWKLVRLLFYPSAFLVFDVAAMIAGLAVTVSRQVEYWRRKQKVLQPSSTPWEVFLAVCLTFIVVNVLFAAAIIGAMEPAGGERALFAAALLLALLILATGIVFVVFFFFGLFNPLPVVFLDGNHIKLGEKTGLGWVFAGNATAVRRFKIVQEGTESTQIHFNDHRGRKRQKTLENSFARFLVLETDDLSEIASGRLEFVVPKNTMHSFESSYNKIAWRLRVYGEIENRPHIDETYPVDVLPEASRQDASRQDASRKKRTSHGRS